MEKQEEMIERLKNNWVAAGGLSVKDREFMVEHTEDVVVLNEWDGWVKVTKHTVACYDIFRLHKDFVMPKEGRWVEYPITVDGGFYGCDVAHINARFNYTFNITHMQGIVGFGGVQFDGQADPGEWSMHVTAGISNAGVVFTCIDASDSNERVAIPVKARFWVEG